MNIEHSKIVLKEYIHSHSKLEMTLRGKSSYILIREDINIEDILTLLQILWKESLEIAFHDSLYPSYTDPGAYFSYSTQKSEDPTVWSMTCGNHGWSGGIYHIQASTLARQILNLVQQADLEAIQITNVIFFSHYELKEEKISAQRNKEIYTLHS